MAVIHSDAEYDAHPLAADTAEPDPEEYRALLGEVARDGLREPVVLFEGRVLEGRRRYRAAIEQGAELEFCELHEISDTGDPAGWALAQSNRVLTGPEVEILREAEQVIERGLAVFVEVGNALLTVRDQRLYRQTHSSFEAWCEQWEVSRRHADRTIAAASVVGLLGAGPVPKTESVARELAALRDDPDALQATWNAVVAEHGERPTAAQTRDAVAQRKGPAKAPAAPAPTAGAGPAEAPADEGAGGAPDGGGAGEGEGSDEPDPWDLPDRPEPAEADPARAKASAILTAIRDLAPASPEDVAKRLKAAGDPAACAYVSDLARYL